MTSSLSLVHMSGKVCLSRYAAHRWHRRHSDDDWKITSWVNLTEYANLQQTLSFWDLLIDSKVWTIDRYQLCKSATWWHTVNLGEYIMWQILTMVLMTWRSAPTYSSSREMSAQLIEWLPCEMKDEFLEKIMMKRWQLVNQTVDRLWTLIFVCDIWSHIITTVTKKWFKYR